MAPKRPQSKPLAESKKKRRAINLEEKLKVIKQYESGKTVNVIARDLGWSHSTVTTILKNRTKITQAVKGAAPMKSTIITKQREGPIADMEKLLATWIEDQNQKRIPLSQMTITEKEEEEEEEPPKRFTVKGLAEMFSTFNSALKQAEDMDPNAERYLLVERKINDAIACYRQIYDEKKRQTKQTTLDIFLKKPSPPTEEPQPGPSGEVTLVFDDDNEGTVEK